MKKIEFAAFAIALILDCGPSLRAQEREAPAVSTSKAPQSGFRPRAVLDRAGMLHVVQASADAPGDLWYVRREPGSSTFSERLRVNSTPGIVAGFDLAVGPRGRVHVLIRPNPKYSRLRMPDKDVLKIFDLQYMLYTRLNDAGDAFEPERDLSAETLAFEGVGTILADTDGRVFAFWHGQTERVFNESSRRIYRAVSNDHGRTFSSPEPVESDSVGACQCCAMAGALGEDGTIALAFRNSRRVGDVFTKDSYLLVSRDRGASFTSTLLDPWREAGCPGSIAAVARGPSGFFPAWRTGTRVMFARPGYVGEPISPTSGATTRAPVLVSNARGELLFVWVALDPKQKRGAGHVVWQLFGADGESLSVKTVVRNGAAPRWGSPTAYATPTGGFEILYDGAGPPARAGSEDEEAP